MSVLLIRADATIRGGTGHVMRQIALAQAWRRARGPVVVLSAQLHPAIEDRLRQEHIGVERIEAPAGSLLDARETARVAASLGAAWVVADSYDLGATWQQAVIAGGHRLAFFDDNGHGAPYAAHVVINQNAHAEESLHPGIGAGARLLLGCRYAILRDEFLASGPRTIDPAAPVEHVVLTLGGSDPDGLTPRLLQAAMQALPAAVRITTIVGSANPHRPAVEAAAAGDDRVAVLHGVRDMASLLFTADISVSAAGTTTWELCYLGVPSLLVVLADNQVKSAHAVHAAGAAYLLGRAGALTTDTLGRHLARICGDADVRVALSAAARALVDGRGRERIVQQLTELEGAVTPMVPRRG